uniref:GTP binding protein n=1 Tax=Solanum tuberosum TaxID=4113 RepID=M1C8T5_SOLTU
MERVSELGQWQKQEVKARGTSWDVKSMDLALWTYDDIQITLWVLDRAPLSKDLDFGYQRLYQRPSLTHRSLKVKKQGKRIHQRRRCNFHKYPTKRGS